MDYLRNEMLKYNGLVVLDTHDEEVMEEVLTAIHNTKTLLEETDQLEEFCEIDWDLDECKVFDV
jgi:ATPase subunit of ABC transporter with duplicated ATPase domains